MKKSQYNVLKTVNGKKYVYNTLSGLIAELDEKTYNYISEKNIKLPKEEIQNLYDAGLLIDNDIDERIILNLNHLKSQFDNKTLGLVIAPTLACNFACPYCFENRINKKMSEAVQDKIIEFVEQHAESGTKILDVTWYGGEPLIFPDVIDGITSRIRPILKKYNMAFKAYIITNGYLANEKNIDVFLKNNIKGAQITIDGTPDIHNQRRILNNGAPTFDIIVNNIKILLKNNINITIRINVDKTNETELENLLKILNKEKLNKCNVVLGQVQSFTRVCKSIESTCVNKFEFRLLEYKFAGLLEKYNFKNPYAKIELYKKNIYCGALRRDYYVIDAEGFAYKCWNDISFEEKTVLKLGEKQTKQMLMNEAKYLTNNPFNNKICYQCIELPLCQGGCPFMEVANNKLCEENSKIFDKCIEFNVIKNEEKVK